MKCYKCLYSKLPKYIPWQSPPYLRILYIMSSVFHFIPTGSSLCLSITSHTTPSIISPISRLTLSPCLSSTIPLSTRAYLPYTSDYQAWIWMSSMARKTRARIIHAQRINHCLTSLVEWVAASRLNKNRTKGVAFIYGACFRKDQWMP